MMKKRIVITGASDGIGLAAARQLKQAGHEVILVGRNAEKTAHAAAELDAPFHLADYARLSDVARLAEELRAYGRIDVLANNAGGLMRAVKTTGDGYEETFQVNLLAGFRLTNLLRETLLASDATVIQTSSIASNLFGKNYDPHNPQGGEGLTPVQAYGNVKLANLLLVREMEKRWGKDGVHAVAFEPGVVRTNFGAEAGFFFRAAYHTPLKYLFTISPEKSAGRLTRLAEGTPGIDFVPGMAYSGKKRFTVWCEKDLDAWGALLWESCESERTTIAGKQ